ncbi:MAG: winged helix-turn-helix transcriptional regulator, partial [Pseudomonadota bacterium]
MDAINDHIVQELSRDCRISNLDLAERVGLSPSACLRRVQDLERRGVIRGYRAGDVVTFDHFRGDLHCALKGLLAR